MGKLTADQIRVLRWIDDNPSTSAAWTVDGKPIRRQKPDKWNVMEIKGKNGSILVPKGDIAALAPFIENCTAPDKMYAPNDTGRAALTSEQER